MKCWRLGNTILAVAIGDLTKASAEAVVNPANSQMIMGGGAAGALKKAGGREIEDEALAKAPVPVGEAIITRAGRLPARFVIHAPTMEAPSMRIPLANAYKASLAAFKAAEAAGIESVALPAMGAGVGGLSYRLVGLAIALAAASIAGRRPRYILLVARGENAYKDLATGVAEALGAEGESCPASLKGLV